ncbi:uncharacterized protein LOC128469745 [Spea bombifrons]|uniref:uncharacterized protein LOC128469745 n=1 Tax=Spea bombifrons TaxID=233779 RepID=UPI00234AC2C5|nr:uncharacterized protein LOC128469745 [Spea bombifrons]
MITAVLVFTMPHGLGILVAISALLPVGYSLQCTSCIGTLSCQGNSVTCPSDYVCASAYMKTTAGGNPVLDVIRSCQPVSKCFVFGSISVLTSTIKFWTSCCFNDNCIPTLTPLSPDSSQLNGVTCPTCISSSSTCDSGPTLRCTGIETVCAQHTVTVNNGIASFFASFRGCFSQSLCDVGSFSANIDGKQLTYTFLCPAVNPVALSSRSCILCHTSGTFCIGSSVICPTGYVCASVLQSVTRGNVQDSTFTRLCQPQSVCSKTGSISYLGGKLKMATSCCDSDNCTPAPPTLPVDNSEKNGVKCPSCSALNALTCDPSQDLYCTGSETQCAKNQRIIINGGMINQEVIVGCSTPAVCEVGGFFVNTSSLKLGMTFECSPAKSSASAAFSHGFKCTLVSLIMLIKYAFEKLPDDSTQPNGVVCKTCTANDAEWCDTEETMKCVGNETKCILQITSMTGTLTQQSVLRGCATQSICNIGNESNHPKYYLLNNFTMRSGLGLLCIFSVFAHTAFSLTCQKCVGMGTQSCDGLSVTCSADEACGASYTVTTANSTELKVYARDCLPKKHCDLQGSVTAITNTKVKMVMSCCFTDDCVPELPELPENNDEPNGLSCRTCYSVDSSWCSSTDTIACKGNENMCLLQSTKLRGIINVQTSYRGCSTKSICSIGSQSLASGGFNIDYSFLCTRTKYW